jgi:AhpD family alkylhydroperoxidase
MPRVAVDAGVSRREYEEETLMVLTNSERELVAIGAAIGAGCQPCLTYHLGAATQAGLSQAARLQALADGERVKRGQYDLLAALGRELLGIQPDAGPSADASASTDPAVELVSIGAAIGANSLPNVREHITAARATGRSPAQLGVAVKVAQAVQKKAAEITAGEVAALMATDPTEAEADTVGAGCGSPA